MFNKICIIGVGLIGGSVARAARERGLCHNIVGLGREKNRDNVQKAKQLGVINEFYFDAQAAVEGADCIVITTPVGAIENVFRELKEFWSDTAVYTDAGSTKIGLLKPEEMLKPLSEDEEIATVATEVQELMLKMVDEAK